MVILISIHSIYSSIGQTGRTFESRSKEHIKRIEIYKKYRSCLYLKLKFLNIDITINLYIRTSKKSSEQGLKLLLFGDTRYYFENFCRYF